MALIIASRYIITKTFYKQKSTEQNAFGIDFAIVPAKYIIFQIMASLTQNDGLVTFLV